MSNTNNQLLDVIAEASYRLHKEIIKAHRENRLDEFLCLLNMEDLILTKTNTTLFESDRDGKIIIFGDSRIKESEIYGCAKQMGIRKDRIEMCLNYNQVKNYEFKKLEYNSRYRLILFGPIPHSGKGKEDGSSIITQIESAEGYPKVIRLTDAHHLKITKTNFKAALQAEIDSGYLAVSSL